MEKDYVLYLQVGDRVYHKRNVRWGVGVVIEERRSEVPGGFCYVRIDFEDGKIRVFDNNFKSATCCYYSGIEKLDVDEEKTLRRDKERKNGPKRLPRIKK
jgi:hypothetical protein